MALLVGVNKLLMAIPGRDSFLPGELLPWLANL
jgi:hypothetical protein